MATRSRALALYRNLIRAAKSYRADSNVRQYAIRRTQERFREAIDVSEEEAVRLVEEGERELGILQRQAVIASLYSHDPSVMDVISSSGRSE